MDQKAEQLIPIRYPKYTGLWPTMQKILSTHKKIYYENLIIYIQVVE